MSSKLVTAVEVGRSLYIYTGDKLSASVITAFTPISDAVAVVRANAEQFQHIQVSHLDWNTLLDWEDRVEKSSLKVLLDSAESRHLTVTYPQSTEG
jgi:hypothetical protein